MACPLPSDELLRGRGLRKISLHATMSVLAFQATALVHVLAGEVEDMRWMVRKVA